MRSKRTITAFTIAELLVAVAITLVIIVVLFQVFAATASQWQSSDQRIDTFRDARAVLQIMARDLGRADINGDAQMLRLSDVYAAGTPPFAKEVYAITPAPNAGKSDLCTVGYYCAYDGNTKAYSLKRVFKDSDVTFTSLATSAPDYDTIYQKDNPKPDEIAAAYVWDLQVRPGIGKDIASPTSSSSTWDWLEIRFKSMSPAAARKIRGTSIDLSTWFDNTSPLYKTFILPYEQQFVSRIVLRQRH
jgi:type II secretory pathway pseudopilin PulG